MENNLIKIALFGPHDRFNYGDFLFPIMLQFAMNKQHSNTFDFSCYSLIKADFTEKGACKSKSYIKLKKDVNAGKISGVIITGGECLNAEINLLYSYINKQYDKLYRLSYFFRALSYKLKIPYRIIGTKTQYPFAVSKNDFNKNVKIIYNSVGGVFTVSNSNVIGNVDYFSVRDSFSFSTWREKQEDIFLFPDSAIILSDVYPIKDLKNSKKYIADKVSTIIQSQYIFFQISNAKYINENKFVEIALQLKQLQAEGYKIVLCPIGTASGHEDHKALKKIYELLNVDSQLIINPTIFEIMILIANSSLYIGSSLHGVITSMSYGVPFISIGAKQTKTKNYLETWSEEKFNVVYEVDNFKNRALEIISNKIKISVERYSKQKELYYESVKKFCTKLL